MNTLYMTLFDSYPLCTLNKNFFCKDYLLIQNINIFLYYTIFYLLRYELEYINVRYESLRLDKTKQRYCGIL